MAERLKAAPERPAAVVKLIPRSSQSREAFRSLCANIRFSGEENRAVLFTSCLPGEGKSYVAYKVAETFAEMGKRTVLVSANLRRSPSQPEPHRMGKGLSHYLLGQAELREILRPSERTEGLSLIHEGPQPADPARLFFGEGFRKLVQELKKHFDYVIVDAPSMKGVIDAAVMGRECDGAVLVIAANTVPYKAAQEAKGQLEKAGCRLLGTVMNKLD